MYSALVHSKFFGILKKRKVLGLQQTKLKSYIAGAMHRDASFVIKNARIINVFTEEVISGDIAIKDDTIIGIGTYSAPQELDVNGAYVCPGFIDSHVHIESSMAHPAGFARTVLEKGTTTVIADPHEIANVSGTKGIEYMLEQTENLPLNVYFMLPSCVPATEFESSGAVLGAQDLLPFLQHERVLGLGEMMDFPGVVRGEDHILEKLSAFSHVPIDGHAPLVRGDMLNAYCVAGPSTDHECSNYDEMLEKLRCGMNILLRMGSAAHGIESIFRRIAWEELPTDSIFFCTDDKHLEDIRRQGHINHIVRRAVACGISPVRAVRMATINPARAYGLKRLGAIAPGYRADLVVVDNLREFHPLHVIAAGKLYSDTPLSTPPANEDILNSVHLAPRAENCFKLPAKEKMPVIELVPEQLVTTLSWREVPADSNGDFAPGWGLNKLAVLERHHATGRIGLGILSGLGIVNGAIASTVGHDSHNLIVAGDNDRDMHLAVNALEACAGGYVVVSGGEVKALLPLPIAGLMSDASLDEILSIQQGLLSQAAALGVSTKSDPFITLSFLALPVIPFVRLTDLGVFDVLQQQFIN